MEVHLYTVDGSEIRRSPVEVKVVEIPLFSDFFYILSVVVLGMSSINRILSLTIFQNSNWRPFPLEKVIIICFFFFWWHWLYTTCSLCFFWEPCWGKVICVEVPFFKNEEGFREVKVKDLLLICFFLITFSSKVPPPKPHIVAKKVLDIPGKPPAFFLWVVILWEKWW